jgi:hypothetical protein
MPGYVNICMINITDQIDTGDKLLGGTEATWITVSSPEVIKGFAGNIFLPHLSEFY